MDGPLLSGFEPNSMCVCGADACRMCSERVRSLLGGLRWRTLAKISWAVVTVLAGGTAAGGTTFAPRDSSTLGDSDGGLRGLMSEGLVPGGLARVGLGGETGIAAGTAATMTVSRALRTALQMHISKEKRLIYARQTRDSRQSHLRPLHPRRLHLEPP